MSRTLRRSWAVWTKAHTVDYDQNWSRDRKIGFDGQHRYVCGCDFCRNLRRFELLDKQVFKETKQEITDEILTQPIHDHS